METKNMKIGEVRSIPNVGDITCETSKDCVGCAFHYPGGCKNANGEAGECMAFGREDNNEVYFPFYKDDELCED